MRRAEACTRRLKTILGRVVRDVGRKLQEPSAKLAGSLELAHRLLNQKRGDTGKLYSIHEPQVECICKGKAHRRYEFGCKVAGHFGFPLSLLSARKIEDVVSVPPRAPDVSMNIAKARSIFRTPFRSIEENLRREHPSL